MMILKTRLHIAPVVAVLALAGCTVDQGNFPTIINYRLQGVVSDAATGSPIEGATVRTDFGQSRLTNSIGHYELQSLDQGIWRIRVTHPAYQDVQRQVTIARNDPDTEANFSLTAR